MTIHGIEVEKIRLELSLQLLFEDATVGGLAEIFTNIIGKPEVTGRGDV
jgi:hypothetical protein